MEKTSRRSILGRHQSCYEERIKIPSDSIECNHHHETLPAYCIPEVVRMEIGEFILEKVLMSPRLLPKIWVQNMLNDQKSGSYLEVSNRTNQL